MSDANPTRESVENTQADASRQAGGEAWEDLCDESELQQGIGRYVAKGNLRLAVFKEKDGIHVIDDECPHAGASLSAGFIEDGSVVCPFHFWTFDAKTGECHSCPGADINTYETRVEAGKVQARLSPSD